VEFIGEKGEKAQDMAFSFITPELIMTGNGCLDDLVLHLSGHGHKAFIVSGKSAVRQGITEKLGKMLVCLAHCFLLL
jgi:alcohol dehydrogenase class IV